MSTDYALHVHRIQHVVWDSGIHRKLPALYVAVKFDDISLQTPTKKKDLSPVWNDYLTFSSPDPSTVVNIQVKHDSRLLRDPCVGFIDITLSELLDESTDGEVELPLYKPTDSASSDPSGVLYLRLKTIDETEEALINLQVASKALTKGSSSHLSAAEDSITSVLSPSIEAVDALSEGSDLHDAIESLLSKLDAFVKLVDIASEIHPFVRAAWIVASTLYKGASNQFKTDMRLVDLVIVMQEAFAFVKDLQNLPQKIQRLELTIKQLLRQTTECCLFIQHYMRSGFIRRMVDSEGRKRIEEFEQALTELKHAMDSGLNLQSAFVTARISEGVDELLLRQRLDPKQVDMSAHHGCLAGTRVDLIEEITETLLSETEPNITWLHGIAGSGKSTIAMTIAEHFRGLYRLGAYIPFKRGKSDPFTVIRTIAFRLASFDSSIALYIKAETDRNKDVASSSMKSQFDKLLYEPLSAAATSLRGPVVIVLDSLDECGTSETRRDLMGLLKDRFPKLPSNIRFLITSRPEGDIRRSFSPCSSFIKKIALDCNSVTSRRDLRTYISHEMREAIMNSDVELPDGRDWDGSIAILATAAEGLFVWASTAVKLVSTSDNPIKKLKELVADSRSVSGFGLEDLYATALRSSGINWEDDESRARFSKVLTLLLFSKVPLSDMDVDRMLNFPPDEPSRLVLARLQCLLEYTPGKPISLSHASISDYLQSSACSSEPWFIDNRTAKQLMASKCFEIMDRMLRFNICDLETSFVRNDDAALLTDRIKRNIPSELEYACLFWAQHLSDAPYSSPLLDALSGFLYRYLLYWFEVLSLLKQFGRTASQELDTAVTWTSSNLELSSFLKDASQLAREFSLPISQSAPHIYVTVLPLTENDSLVSAHYSKRTSSMVAVERKGIRSNSPPAWLNMFEGHTDYVTSVVFTPDGKRIVSGSNDRTVRVWDADVGVPILEPIEGHADKVSSVDISPDGLHIISGSKDKTVRVWDASTGAAVSAPFTGHAKGVLSVSFSPNGTQIVSGSSDNTAIVWDRFNGNIFRTFKGHSGPVSSVSFSRDGTRIASGSEDKTVIIWDIADGSMTTDPLKGHTQGVLCVSFSPDSTRVVSSSYDKSIIVWDVKSGQLISGPFKGHIRSVFSVFFSRDGKRVISGSGDHKIIIWDVASGNVVSRLIKGHTNSILSVAPSPDGMSIVSGSKDNTIRRWDMKSKELVSAAFEGHTSDVHSAVFSPEGNRIASGSEDKTIIIWHAVSRDVISGPFEGHTKGITSVSFSPDGTRIVSGSKDKTAIVWDVESGEALFTFKGHTSSVMSVGFSPDGTYVVSGSWDKTIRIWDVVKGIVAYNPFKGHTASVRSVVFSSDGEFVASGSGDHTIKFWAVKGGAEVFKPIEGHTSAITSVALSRDGSRIVSGALDRSMKIWDVKSGELISEPFKGVSRLLSVSFSPDGSRVVSSSKDKIIRVWDTASGERVSGLLKVHTEEVLSVGFSPEGDRIVSGSGDNTLRVWDARGQEVDSETFEGHSSAITSVAYSPNGTRIVSGDNDGSIRSWDDNGNIVSRDFAGHTKMVSHLTFSPDGERVATCSYDKTIKVWLAETGELTAGPLKGHKDSVTFAAFSPDGTRIASCSKDKTVRFWDVEIEELISRPILEHAEAVWSVAFAPDGKRIVSGCEREIVVWDVESGEIVVGPLKRHTGRVLSIMFSPDGTKFVSGSSDRTVRIWDSSSGKQIGRSKRGHTGYVWSVAYMSDGKRVVSGSSDNTVRVWNVKGKELYSGPFKGHTRGVLSISLSPDNTRIVSGGRDRVIRIWNIKSGRVKAVKGTSSDGQSDESLVAPFPLDSSRVSKWTLLESGWVVGEKGELLLWLPPDFRASLWRPQNTAIFNCTFSTKLDFKHTAHGARWDKCFKPPL